ncbi:MAG: flagellar hook-length control protein FliK [Gemmataceae bacterium]|nr:flagellar hook-length control protein FliK [Gemmataceae bacterium]
MAAAKGDAHQVSAALSNFVMASIAALLLPTAANGTSGTAAGSTAVPGTSDGTTDEAANFSQMLQAMLIGVGLLQATPQSPSVQVTGLSPEGANTDLVKAGGCGLAGKLELAGLASKATGAMSEASLVANQLVQPPVLTGANLAPQPVQLVQPGAPELAAVQEQGSPQDLAPAIPLLEKASLPDAVAQSDNAQLAVADATTGVSLRTEAPSPVEPPLRDDDLRQTESLEATVAIQDAENLNFDSLQPTKGSELQTTANKRRNSDDTEALVNAQGDAEAVQPAPHAEGARPLSAEAKPREAADSVSEQVRNRIVDQIETAREHGRVELRFDLHPPELGRMRLNLTSQDHSLSVRVWAESDQARQMLESQMDALRQRLAEGGISLGSFNVGRDSGGARLPYKPPESFVQSLTSAPADDASRLITRFRWAAGAGVVDVMA